MIRAVALLLVVANLGLLIWGLGHDRHAPTEAAPRREAQVRAPATLTLLSEADGGRAARPGGPDAAAVADPPAPDALSCERVGPFASRVDADAALARADSLGIAAVALDRDEVNGAPDYQVYLPPLPTVEQARRQVRELKALDIEAYVIDRPGLEQAISVGLFTDEANADARRDQVARLGYEVRVERLERTRPVVDVLLGPADRATLDPFIAGLVRDWPDVVRRRSDCPAPAAGSDGAADAAAGA